jgi:ribosomal protein S18 acetylase RimI-like enzyme
MTIRIEDTLDSATIEQFLTGVFDGEMDDADQDLPEWFDVTMIPSYMPFGHVVVARDDHERIVGLMILGKQNPLTWPDGHKVEIFVIGVSPDVQSMGIGKALLVEAERVARGMGGRKLILNAHAELDELHAYYTARGFVEIGVLREYYDNGDATFLVKRL